jgi:hypothetical protein
MAGGACLPGIRAVVITPGDTLPETGQARGCHS